MRLGVKQLKLVRLVANNTGITKKEAIDKGFEETMIDGLRRKGALAGADPAVRDTPEWLTRDRLYVPPDMFNHFHLWNK